LAFSAYAGLATAEMAGPAQEIEEHADRHDGQPDEQSAELHGSSSDSSIRALWSCWIWDLTRDDGLV
jgi:hypothetical protein